MVNLHKCLKINAKSPLSKRLGSVGEIKSPLGSERKQTTVSDISTDDIERTLAGVTDGALNNALKNIRTVFNFGMDKGYCQTNPVNKSSFADRGFNTGVFFIWNQFTDEERRRDAETESLIRQITEEDPGHWDRVADRVLAEAKAEKRIGRKSWQL